MSETPEVVWICSHLGDYGRYYPEAVEAEGEHGGFAREYIRRDLARAQVAMAYEAAANKVSIHMLGRNKEFADRVVAHVRALNPDDAKAAFEAALKAERDKSERFRAALEEIKRQFGGIKGGHMAAIIATRALAQEGGE